jgi:hypothetical protein
MKYLLTLSISGLLCTTVLQAADFEAGSIGAKNSAGVNFFNGKVGVGQSSPTYDLDVKGNILRVGNAGAANTQLVFDRFSTELGRFPYINFRKSHSDTFGASTQTEDSEHLGQLIMRGVNSSNVFKAAAKIGVRQDGASGAGVPGRMEFYTSTSAVGERIRMTIKSDGSVGIGTQTPTENLHVAGAARFDGGISYVAPLGDISMGIFTNSP